MDRYTIKHISLLQDFVSGERSIEKSVSASRMVALTARVWSLLLTMTWERAVGRSERRRRTSNRLRWDSNRLGL